jgi:UDP-N-acetylmuramoyl-tripeptide--D-alanyl-D-alanine ligase
MRFQVTELCGALGAQLVGPHVDEVVGLATDSRAVAAGQLFAAVRAERDGHDFAAAAHDAGAAAVLVERPIDGVPSLVVPDVRAALVTLAGVARDRLPERVVGITGSVGKTTTKDLLAAVLSERFVTAASERSFNNELGVPLTLCNAPDDAEAVVVEMGARGSGHIAFLCEMARPDVGVVTTVQAVHTELMGTEADIARTKGELIESLPSSGLAVLNAAVPLVAAMASRSSARVVTFGEGGDVQAHEVQVDADLRPSFRLTSPWGEERVRLGVRGVHNVDNALAAAAVALFLGLSLEQVVAGLASSDQSPWRMDLRVAPGGARVLNDAYNAAPASVAAALRALAALDADRRTAVLGLMAELGDRSADEHRRVASLADELGIRLVAVDTELYGVEPVAGVDGALEALGPLDDGDAVLVKASRVVGLERLAAALLG